MRQYIQNKIMISTKIDVDIPPFPLLPPETWAIILGPATKRDPIETLGDAAMQVVMTEIITKLVDEMDEIPAILGPLLSNATFLAVLRSKGVFTTTSDHIPKYPGNALEVFAGALAKFCSIIRLKEWVEPTFSPVITVALDARNSFFLWVPVTCQVVLYPS
ncbi:hypothetical protein DFH06DRAFT_951573, partial [Mycena polygramma]